MARRRRYKEPSAQVNARRHRWAERERARLLAQLGGRCVACSSTTRLEFDHINGRTWDVKPPGPAQRLRRYRAEIAQGLIQLLCKACNVRKGASVPAPTLDDVPF